MISASVSQVGAANCWSNFCKCAPASQHQQAKLIWSLRYIYIYIFFNEWVILVPKRPPRLFSSLYKAALSVGTVNIVVVFVLFIYISSIFENAATLCALFCFLLRNWTVSWSPSLIFDPIMNCVKKTYLFCIDKVWLQSQEMLALFCFLSSFISKLTKAYRNQISDFLQVTQWAAHFG